MIYQCEICRKEEATGTKFLTCAEAPNSVSGTYRIGPKCGGPKNKTKDTYSEEEQ